MISRILEYVRVWVLGDVREYTDKREHDSY
jgi:hypothetical protein